jgi:hypothetical protein
MTVRLWAVDLEDGRQAQGFGRTDQEARALAINLFQQMTGNVVTRVTADGVYYKPAPLDRFSELPQGEYATICFRQNDGSIICRKCSCADPATCTCNNIESFSEEISMLSTKTRRRFQDNGNGNDPDSWAQRWHDFIDRASRSADMREQLGDPPDLGDEYDDTDADSGLVDAARSNLPTGGPAGAGANNFGGALRKYSESFDKFSDAQRSDVQRIVRHAEKNRGSWERGFGHGSTDEYIRDGIGLIDAGMSADQILLGTRR